MKILSGIQPTGQIHIGNYVGAIKQWVELQKENECIFLIVDLHSLTIPYRPEDLQRSILEKAISYLAAGINPKKSIIFVQSKVKEHAELAWILNTICPVGELERMTQYKEKSNKFKNNVNAGLLSYPVLMAADILLYKTTGVPVGEDQVQHLELTRALARKFNKKFGETLPVPKAILPKVGARIMSLQNPRSKMSKSDPGKSYISLFDSPKDLKNKIMSAVTDTGKEIKYDPEKKPGISNLLTIYSVYSEKTIKQLEKDFKNKRYSDFKKSLAKLLIEKLKSFRKKKKELTSNKEKVEKVLNNGAKRAQKIAQKTMKEVKRKMGLV